MNAYKTEYAQRAEQTQARRRAKGMYRRPTAAQDVAYRKCIARDGDKSLTIEELDLLADYPYFAASQRAKYATRAAQAKFAAMLTAMVGDAQPAPVDDVDYDAEADDYAEYMLDIEWMREGC